MKLLFTLLFALGLFSASFAAGIGFNSQPLGYGLVAWYTFNEGSGSVANDYSGMGNTGYLTNTPAWTNGVLAGALTFNGTSQGVKIPTFYSGSSVITASFWMKKTNNGTGDQMAIELGPGVDHWFYIDPNWSGASGKSAIALTCNGIRRHNFTSPTLNQWHLWCVVVDNSTASGNILVYIDSSLTSTVADLTTKSASGTFTNLDLNFMSRRTTSLFNEGSLDDVRIYNRALTAEEVRMLYNGGAGSQR